RAGHHGGDAPRAGRTDRRWLVVGLLVGLPIVILVIALAQRTWYPTGDLAQAELRMRSLPDRPPLLGAAGRIVDEQGRQGNHPGPLMFWATWPLYALLGRSAWAFEAATALVNLAWLSASVWLVARRAGTAVSAWYGVTALVLIGGYGLNALSQPWNPWVALLPFTVLVLATWSALAGDRWMAVLAVAAGSYAIQGHVGYAPVVLPLVALALAAPAWAWWRGRRGGREREAPPEHAGARGAGVTSGPRRWLVPTLVAIGVGLLAWSGPVVDLFRNEPSNVAKLLDNFGSPSETPIGLSRGVEAVLQSAAPFGAWMRGGGEVTGSIVPGLLLLLAWAASAVLVARREGAGDLTRLNLVLAVATAFGVVAVSRIFGALYLYVFRWIAAIVALQVFALGWALARLLPRPSPTTARRAGALALVALVGLSAFTAQRIVRQQIPYDQSWRMERVLAPRVADQLDPDRSYLVTWDDPAYLGGLGFGLVLELERRGFTVGAEPRFSAAVE
ncbi:MAG TPA: hypothetical protein VHK88_01595, partial [Aquihabitans sp.]|nr:hypothetical protein [Aquihabitans sp.]